MKLSSQCPCLIYDQTLCILHMATHRAGLNIAVPTGQSTLDYGRQFQARAEFKSGNILN